MRYFIITSGPAEGVTFEMPDEATDDLIRHKSRQITIGAVIEQDGPPTQEITAEQYADESEGEE